MEDLYHTELSNKKQKKHKKNNMPYPLLSHYDTDYNATLPQEISLFYGDLCVDSCYTYLYSKSMASKTGSPRCE